MRVSTDEAYGCQPLLQVLKAATSHMADDQIRQCQSANLAPRRHLANHATEQPVSHATERKSSNPRLVPYHITAMRAVHRGTRVMIDNFPQARVWISLRDPWRGAVHMVSP